MKDRESQLELDSENMFADAIGTDHGLTPEEFDRLAPRTEQITEKIQERRGADVGFMELPYDDDLVETIQGKAEELHSWCKNFVVLGIGGSALGNITVNTALLHPHHNLLPDDHPARDGAPRIFVLDNVDPVRIQAIEKMLADELPKTAFNVITKSGSTAETMSEFLHFRDLLDRTDGCDPARQMILTTDPNPEKSLLRRIANDGAYFALPIPDNVGGRFSVLSAVGLMSSAVAGVDIDRMLDGAAEMDERCCDANLYDNPAALYACLLYANYQKGKPMSVLMPYSHKLRALADWYCQLWAESLGKRDGLDEKDVFRGPTPIASVGVTDQHSVMQLYQDGPFDKVITFVEVEDESDESLVICEGSPEEELEYLADNTFDGLFQAELTATRCALRDKHRPNCSIVIPRVDAADLGALFMFFEYAVTYSGYLYNVNTFNQPGVELGKEYTYGLMGRKGYEPPRL